MKRTIKDGPVTRLHPQTREMQKKLAECEGA